MFLLKDRPITRPTVDLLSRVLSEFRVPGTSVTEWTMRLHRLYMLSVEMKVFIPSAVFTQVWKG